MGVKILGAAMLVLLANVGQGSQVYAKTILPRPAVQRPATAESGTAKQAISLGLHVANERLAEPLTHTLGYAQSSRSCSAEHEGGYAKKATFGLGSIGHLGGNTGQLATFTAHNATDERGENRHMLDHTTAEIVWIALFQDPQYGTIAMKRQQTKGSLCQRHCNPV
ncbi:MAG: hypothetical protein ETSY1_46730 (plasmid) [Candidatus Entotheonella factor]|uniref:Uncharacterized protein n=1 Tax=Entotheonella factor TaxID=1429438 RepID=W4M0A0_ENTF1|nr:MAG: hypothetical protein ETSY1_46730 [Candidatus Entotheonella factor]